jgi:Protein of unknown function (DUF1588)/Protein of unknown function (DUF1592)/Protein of unknown function (DUF1595)/Protein of unknown function (DUF1587)
MVTSKSVFLGLSVTALFAGCTGSVGSTPASSSGGSVPPPGGSGSGASSSSGGTSATGGSGGGGAGTSSSGNGGAVASDNPLLPARIRRLTNAEYDASVQALLGTAQTPAATSFPLDARQNNFTVNDAQRVDPVLAKLLSDTAIALTAEARTSGKLAALSPCANPTTGGADCATTFIQSFGAKAYRRTLTTDEVSALQTIYGAGIAGGAYNDGIDAVVQAVLQSAGFMYSTEIGDGSVAASGVVTLTPAEVASTLSFLVASAPPDDPLATAGSALMNADAREQQARRLLATSAGQAGLVRVIREWLGVDQINQISKDSTVYGSFAGLLNSITTESVSFVDQVVNHSTGTLTELLGADWTVADAGLASLYGATSVGTGHTPVARRGILNQAAFLSVYAHASESAPVLRGVAVMKRVACLTVISPLTLNIVVTPPVPDPNKTTRQRYAIHATDPTCAACHTSIDGFGFAFEGYDGMGATRPVSGGVPTENNHPTDSSTTIAGTADYAGSYPDSNAMAVALSTSAAVRSCMAHQVFRSFAARSDASVQGSEQDFVNRWGMLDASKQNNFVETLVAYVRSPNFVQRRAQ